MFGRSDVKTVKKYIFLPVTMMPGGGVVNTLTKKTVVLLFKMPSFVVL